MKPTVEVELNFPRLNFQTTVSTYCWRPFDPDLTAGSDIAILELEQSAPVDSWVKLETNRPQTDTEVVALEFQTARADGDPREATVHFGEGSVISLKGHGFIEQGMSGTGIFHQVLGERLLGLVAWKTTKHGQTDAYAIPSEEIAKFISESSNGTTGDVGNAEFFEILTEIFLEQIGDNLRPLVEEVVSAARSVMEKPARTWSRYDIEDLIALDIEIREFVENGSALSPMILQVLKKLEQLSMQLSKGENSKYTETVVLNSSLLEELDGLGLSLREFMKSKNFPSRARQPAESLLRSIKMSIVNEKIRPLQLSRGNENLRRAAGDIYCSHERLIPTLLGRRSELLPEGTIFIDCEELWSPEMIIVQGGSFLMGSPREDTERENDEGPQATKNVSKIAVSRFLVSFKEFQCFCECENMNIPDDSGWGRHLRPVIYVNFDDAQRFCEFLASKTDKTYRLPSETEWEYICKKGYNKEAVLNVLEQRSRTWSERDGQLSTYQLDDEFLKPDRLGVHHMIGNVWQWCSTVYVDEIAPVDLLPANVTPNTYMVARGGSWNSPPQGLRESYRNRFKANYRNNDVGFRVVREI